MEQITLRDLVFATQGRLLGDASEDTIITNAQSDNRKVGPGSVFFAFIGENTDGHKYVDAALDMGACGAVVSREPEEKKPGHFYVLVEDTIVAAGELAKWYRKKFDIPVIGVTGSVGKTTMKDMIASVLSQKFNVLKTEANFNNNIGLPRTILRLSQETEMAVIEMGMNHMGEIDYLVRIAQPDCAVITNIGEAHIGNLGSRENIFKAKCEIFHGLKDGGFAVMNADDDYLPKLRDNQKMQDRFTFTWVGEDDNAEWKAVDIQDTLQECVKFTMVSPKGQIPVIVPALGRHMIYPSLVAAALGDHYGMTLEEIVAGIAAYVPTALRMEKLVLGQQITIYNDTYNANPQSMKAGLTTLSNTIGEIKVAVLGDMFELGDMEEELHRGVGAVAASLYRGNVNPAQAGEGTDSGEAVDGGKDAAAGASHQGIDILVTVGKRAKYIADEAKKGGFDEIHAFDDVESAKSYLEQVTKANTVLYFKASHSMHLDQLAEFCKGIAE